MSQQNKTIVVVDDDPGMNQALERLLNVAGFRVTTFASAEEFLEAEAAKDAACLVLDIHLSGISGFELQQRLALSGAVPPVIFMTAYDDEEARTNASRVGANAYFAKPFSGRSLISAIAGAIKPDGTGSTGKGRDTANP